jgi:hypothetical protein
MDCCKQTLLTLRQKEYEDALATEEAEYQRFCNMPHATPEWFCKLHNWLFGETYWVPSERNVIWERIEAKRKLDALKEELNGCTS